MVIKNIRNLGLKSVIASLRKKKEVKNLYDRKGIFREG